MIHLEPGHRVVGETIAARFNAAADKREAVDVRAADLDDVQYHVQVAPEDRNLMHIHVWVRNFKEIEEQVGEQYFQELYPGMLAKPAKGYSISLAVNLDTIPEDKTARGTRPCCQRSLSWGGALSLSTPPPASVGRPLTMAPRPRRRPRAQAEQHEA